VLAIVSGKGGVGKSTLAVNIAAAAARAGRAPLLIDGDVGLANADLLLGLVPRHDLGDCDASAIAPAEVLCPGPAGLELLVVGSRRSAVARLARGLVGDVAEPLSALFAARALILLDLGAGIGADVIELARHCDPVWLVATPEPTSLADAYATVKQLWERAPRLRIELVVNRVSDRAAGERTRAPSNAWCSASSAAHCRCARCCPRIPRWARRSPGKGPSSSTRRIHRSVGASVCSPSRSSKNSRTTKRPDTRASSRACALDCELQCGVSVRWIEAERSAEGVGFIGT